MSERTDARTPAELVTPGEVARMAGVQYGAVSNWRVRHADFPPAWYERGRSVLFVRDEVETWLAGRAADDATRADRLREQAAALIARAEELSPRRED